MEQFNIVSIGIVIVALTIFWSAVVGLLYRYTSRYAIGSPVTWRSGFLSALVGLPLFFGVIGFTIDSALRAGLLPGSLPLIAVAATGLVVALLLSSFANAILMRRIGGGRVSYGEACRVQLVPTALIIVLAIASRL